METVVAGLRADAPEDRLLHSMSPASFSNVRHLAVEVRQMIATPGQFTASGRQDRVLSTSLVLSTIWLALGLAHVDVSGEDVSLAWRQRVSDIVWVGYSPPSADPNRGIQAGREAIRGDLATLRQAGFTGLVSYGASRAFLDALVAEAKAQGFLGLVPGIWNPNNTQEIAAVAGVAGDPIVVGTCIGNEGYGKRYSRAELLKAIDGLRQTTGKPVTTAEEMDDYLDEEVWALGDWVFPNAHPYFHGRYDPEASVRWTQGAFAELRRRTGRFVWFKEVGLPTSGDVSKPLSEIRQDKYYVELAKTRTLFTYFEAFDQPWKGRGTVEQHWGIFRSDRTPKRLAQRLLTEGPLPRPSSDATNGRERSHAPPSGDRVLNPFYLYLDAGSPENHFAPTVYDGDCGDIRIDEAFAENPRSGKTCIRIAYEPKGKGPNECAYAPPCKWAALGWRHPPNNKGKDPRLDGKGHDLSGFGRLTFAARADEPCKLRFSVGGVDEAFGDSMSYPRNLLARLDQTWKEFVIDLRDADLRHMITGFTWATNWETSPHGVTFYLDDVRFEPWPDEKGRPSTPGAGPDDRP